MKKYKMTFDNIDKAYIAFCGQRFCSFCPLSERNSGKNMKCKDFKANFPKEVAEIMGLEVVEVEDKDKPRLTEQELAICKAVGAKWVSRDEGEAPYVRLYKSEPYKKTDIRGNTYYTERDSESEHIGNIDVSIFSSLNCGDLVNVEELLKEAEQ